MIHIIFYPFSNRTQNILYLVDKKIQQLVYYLHFHLFYSKVMNLSQLLHKFVINQYFVNVCHNQHLILYNHFLKYVHNHLLYYYLTFLFLYCNPGLFCIYFKFVVCYLSYLYLQFLSVHCRYLRCILSVARSKFPSINNYYTEVII